MVAATSPVVLCGYIVIAFSRDSRWLATDSEDDITRLWDLTASYPVASPVILRGTTGIAFSPDGRWLPIARRGVEQHGGEVRGQSRLGEGTTFFDLPLYVPP